MIIHASVPKPDEDFILEVKKKVDAYNSFSHIVVCALKLWFKDPANKNILPEWQIFRKSVMEMNDLDFEEIKQKIHHFECIIKATDEYRKSVVR